MVSRLFNKVAGLIFSFCPSSMANDRSGERMKRPVSTVVKFSVHVGGVAGSSPSLTNVVSTKDPELVTIGHYDPYNVPFR